MQKIYHIHNTKIKIKKTKQMG